MNPISAAWPLSSPLDVIGNTASSRTGRADSTGFVRDGRVWHAAYYRAGAATLSVWAEAGQLRAEAWGEGAADALGAVPAFVGLADDPDGFEAPAFLRDTAARFPGMRLGATGNIFDALVPAILGQKVIGLQALRSYQTLVRRVRTRAPLAHVSRRPLFMPPTPDEVLTALSGHGAATLAIDISRASALREVAVVAHLFDALVTKPASEVRAALEAIPGVGEWTSNHATAAALGDPDAVPVGDYHLKNIVGFAFTGAPRSSDETMVELLAPFRPHRARVLRLIGLSGVRAPRYGAKLSLPEHLPLMTSHRPSRDAEGPSRRSRTRRPPR